MNYKSINKAIVLSFLGIGIGLMYLPFFLYQTSLPTYFPKIVDALGLPPKDFPVILQNLKDSMHIYVIRNSGVLSCLFALFAFGFIKFSKNKYQDKDIFYFLLVFIAFNYLFFTNSYICDDSLITCRTADNFVNGYGLRWNVIERVQSFTNPPWLFLIIFFYYPLQKNFGGYWWHFLMVFPLYWCGSSLLIGFKESSMVSFCLYLRCFFHRVHIQILFALAWKIHFLLCFWRGFTFAFSEIIFKKIQILRLRI
jgi:hypothetical protein